MIIKYEDGYQVKDFTGIVVLGQELRAGDIFAEAGDEPAKIYSVHEEDSVFCVWFTDQRIPEGNDEEIERFLERYYLEFEPNQIVFLSKRGTEVRA